MELLRSILPTLVASLSAALLVLFIAARSKPSKFRLFLPPMVAVVLVSVLSNVAKTELSISSMLGFIVVWVVVGLFVAGLMAVFGAWKRTRSTDA